jgi:Flp pilus assembly protein TadG
MGAAMKKRINIRNEQGQTMTEFAVVLPILVVLLFGIIQFGIAFNNYVTLTDAARAGARKGAVSRNASNPVAACTNQVYTSASDLKSSQLQVTCSSTWAPGSDVTVDAQYPYSIDLFGIPVVNGMLQTTITERVE